MNYLLEYKIGNLVMQEIIQLSSEGYNLYFEAIEQLAGRYENAAMIMSISLIPG